jgi:hypothetical protein
MQCMHVSLRWSKAVQVTTLRIIHEGYPRIFFWPLITIVGKVAEGACDSRCVSGLHKYRLALLLLL